MDLEKYSKKLEQWSDKELSKTEGSIRLFYRKLVKEILAQIGLLYEKYEVDGKLTYAEMMKFERFKKFLASMNEHIQVLSDEVQTSINTLLYGTYTYSYAWMAHAIETNARKSLQLTTLKLEQVQKAMNNPVTGLTLSDRLGKQRRDIVYQVQQNVTQGLVRGSTYKEMASQIQETFEGDYAKSIRVVRTETHRVREQATLDSALRANEKGIIMLKKWRNMKDSRVRKTSKANHVKMDQVKIPVDDLFDLGKGEYTSAPGSSGYAHHDINCRCILVYEIDRIEGRTNEQLAEQTFEDYRKAIEVT